MWRTGRQEDSLAVSTLPLSILSDASIYTRPRSLKVLEVGV